MVNFWKEHCTTRKKTNIYGKKAARKDKIIQSYRALIDGDEDVAFETILESQFNCAQYSDNSDCNDE